MVGGYNNLPNFSLNLRESQDELKTGLVEELVELAMDPQEPTKILKVGKNLEGKVKEKLETFRKGNLDVFAWEHTNMVAIFLEVICHCLNIDPEKRPFRQK